MNLRPTALFRRLFDSLWFVPSAMTVLAGLLAWATVEIDRSFAGPELATRIWFLFDIGAEGARATLTAIATSVITVTGVVFSVTIVALQLAASQFSPRVLRTYLADRGNQTVLGVFIATFTYTLLVQRTVGTGPDASAPFVPYISVTLSILAVLISIGALIYFVNHIAQSIRASVIIDHVAGDALRIVDELFPGDIGEAAEEGSGPELPPLPVGPPHQIRSRRAGYLDAVDGEALLSLASEGRGVVRMELKVGEFVLPGDPLASLWFDSAVPSAKELEKVERKVRRAFALGGHWTLHQDLERALVELTDIALRALSPSLHDPTTAAMCVDRVGEILARLGNRRFPPTHRTDETGRVRFIARQLSWQRAVESAFEKLRRHGAGYPSVVCRMLEICGRIKARTPRFRHGPLDDQIRELMEAAHRSFTSESDLRTAEAICERALKARTEKPALISSETGVEMTANSRRLGSDSNG